MLFFRVRAAILALLLLSGLASPAGAQLLRRAAPAAGPPPGTPPGEAEIWPFPPPDPKGWWEDKRPKPPEAADPLGGRKLPRGQRLPQIDNGVDPATYRMWALMPLQWQVLRNGEMILEVWVRPARNVRQSIVRVTVRNDGRAFVQARAGFACCEAGIGRRIGFDAELPAGSAQTFLALRDSPVWDSPRDVQAVRNASTTDVVCVDGVSYDVTLVVPGRSRSLHRACDDIAVGQIADVLEPALRAAYGREPRFDVLYPGGISFAAERDAYRAFAAQGGVLQPDPQARRQPPGDEPAPQPEP
jgi:hypothetical protein